MSDTSEATPPGRERVCRRNECGDKAVVMLQREPAQQPQLACGTHVHWLLKWNCGPLAAKPAITVKITMFEEFEPSERQEQLDNAWAEHDAYLDEINPSRKHRREIKLS